MKEEDCARMMRKLGLDQRPGIHVESVQICPNGRGVILITLKKDIQIERFCCHDVLEVTQSGIRAVHVKPAGKREVVVTMKGIHPNTRDDGVIDYLSKFGKVVTTKVIHGMFGDGPLKGLRNGDRSYKVEIKATINLGTYHVIDGQKVTARYPGQQQTCARCFGTPRDCPGKGMARRCEAERGPKIEFTDYILKLWESIGYNPGQVELNDEINEEHVVQDGGLFTPVKLPTDPDKFGGICVKMIPKETDQAEVIEFLITSGLSETNKENISFKPNGTVMVNNLENTECEVLIAAIHTKTVFGKRLYCNGVVPLTPVKPEDQQQQQEQQQLQQQEQQQREQQMREREQQEQEQQQQQVQQEQQQREQQMREQEEQQAQQEQQQREQQIREREEQQQCEQQQVQHHPQQHHQTHEVPTGLSTTATVTATTNTTISTSKPVTTETMPSPLSPMSPTTFSQQYSETPDILHLQLTNDQLVRRNSLSLRSPPAGSLAKEILSAVPSSQDHPYDKAKSILSNLREMTERFSDFASADSASFSEDSDEGRDKDGFRVQDKRKKSRKHRLSITPPRDFFLKKPNTAVSPQYYS